MRARVHACAYCSCTTTRSNETSKLWSLQLPPTVRLQISQIAWAGALMSDKVLKFESRPGGRQPALPFTSRNAPGLFDWEKDAQTASGKDHCRKACKEC